jgi:hypothetical protein
MAKQRVVNTRFWNDPWVMEELNPLDKLLFLYFLTNDQTNLSGIYEISHRVICFETGIEKETLTKAMIPRLGPKVFYEDGWIIIPNFPKHQNTENPKIMAGIQRELALVPDEIYEKAIAYGYPIHRESHLTKLNLTKPIGTVETSSTPSLEEFCIESNITADFEDDQLVYRDPNGKKVSLAFVEREYRAKYKIRKESLNDVYNSLLRWAEDRRGKRFSNPTKQFKAFQLLREAGYQPGEIKQKWEEMENDKFWRSAGFDFMNVQNQLDKAV